MLKHQNVGYISSNQNSINMTRNADEFSFILYFKINQDYRYTIILRNTIFNKQIIIDTQHILMIVYWNNFHGSLSHHWLNVRCLLLTEGWCYLRDLSSGASFLIWHCSALTGSRVWVPPTESETTNHHKDRNREAVSTEISPSSEIGVQGWHHIEIH